MSRTQGKTPDVCTRDADVWHCTQRSHNTQHSLHCIVTCEVYSRIFERFTQTPPAKLVVHRIECGGYNRTRGGNNHGGYMTTWHYLLRRCWGKGGRVGARDNLRALCCLAAHSVREQPHSHIDNSVSLRCRIRRRHRFHRLNRQIQPVAPLPRHRSHPPLIHPLHPGAMCSQGA